MWCNVCDKPVQPERKCTGVKHIESACTEASWWAPSLVCIFTIKRGCTLSTPKGGGHPMVFMARCCRLVVSKRALVEGICGSGGGAYTVEGKGFWDPAPYRAFLGAAAKRAADHLTNVRAKNPKQWRFYKELRILNPANLSTMSHDISLYSTLRLPLPLSVTCGVERDLCAK